MAKGSSLFVNTKKGKVREALRNPIDVLSSLNSKAKDEAYYYERLYRNLYNSDFFLIAYQNIYANTGNMTAGVDGKTIDGMGMDRINKLIESLKNHSYQPSPARRIYIKKKNGKLRPLGIPSFDDKLVQEVVRMILESIYEPTFSKYSHGFRPKRSCHTALLQIQDKFIGAKWFIEGDIHGFFDNINHATMVSILRKRIKDEYFLALIWKFLKAGYVENWVFHKTYSGTPQGSIISPILSNIYPNEFDKYMEEYIDKFWLGKNRAPNKKYQTLLDRAAWIKRGKYTPEASAMLSDEEKQEKIKQVKQFRTQAMKLPSRMQRDENFKRLHYVRYADDWLCGIIGSKADAENIKEDIKNFLRDKLQLDLSDEKTLITNGNDAARFLGYDIFVTKNDSAKKDKNG